MSASNWAFCPRCMYRRQLRLDQLEAELAAAYGKVPVEEFDRLRGDLDLAQREGVREEHDESFREDYSITGAPTGGILVRYKGACETCGLACAFEHDVPFWSEADGTGE